MIGVKEIMVGNTSVIIMMGDITSQSTDALVNAANPGLMGGGGVDGAIHRAGGPSIKDECKGIIARIGRLKTGNAVITGGGNLKAKYVIHTVGPIWNGGKSGEPALLASAYVESLKLATAYKLKSIAFPSISTGAYGYPLAEAATIALQATINYLKENQTPLLEIYFVLYDSNAFNTYSEKLDLIKI